MSTISPLVIPRRGKLTVSGFEARFGKIRAMTDDNQGHVISAVTSTKYVYFDHTTQSYVTESR